MSYYLAIDIGASSGRHILGSLENGKLNLEEIYRFENGMAEHEGMLCWDTDALFSEIIKGMAECKRLGKIPCTLSVDTWGVDYVLLDHDGKEILPVRAYRDKNNTPSSEKAHEIIPFEELYRRTGIQYQPFNSIYQLYYDKTSGRSESAADMLLIPDYFTYRLTGVKKCEYTNATTGAFVNAQSGDTDEELLCKLGIERKIIKDISQPCTYVGDLLPEIADKVGFDCEVILCPSHDTSCAVAACPLDEKTLFLSSGTWSLIGAEIDTPIVSDKAKELNFSNEGGICGRINFLKNIMGTWIISGIRKTAGIDPDSGKKYTYDELMKLAESGRHINIIDVNDPTLSAPENMLEALKALIGKDNISLADVLVSVYHSLAAMYASSVKEIESLTGREYERLMVVGGGSRDDFLCRLTAMYTKKKVLTGLYEATAIGNILSQLMAHKGISLEEARKTVLSSFDIKEIL